jgi:hypothetical protein
MSRNGGSQLHSETQAGPTSAVADRCASDSMGSTVQPPTASGVLVSKNSDGGCGMTEEGKQPPTSVRRNAPRKGRAGGINK